MIPEMPTETPAGGLPPGYRLAAKRRDFSVLGNQE